MRWQKQVEPWVVYWFNELIVSRAAAITIRRPKGA